MTPDMKKDGAPLADGLGAVCWGIIFIFLGVVLGMLIVFALCGEEAKALTLSESDQGISLMAQWDQSVDPEPSSGCCSYILEIYEDGISDDNFAFTFPVADTQYVFDWVNGAWCYARIMAIDSAGNESEWSQWAIYCPFDINDDGMVDIDDRRMLRKYYGQQQGGANWEPALDYNDDGIIDIDDGRMLKKQEGRKVQ